MTPVDVVVVAHRSAGTLARCLDSVLHDPQVADVVVVDNASPDDSAAIAERAGATVVRDGNRGFGAGCNAGAAKGSAPYVLFLNPDAAVEPGAVARLATRLDHDASVAIVAPQVILPDGSNEPVARRAPAARRAILEPGPASRLDAWSYRRRAPRGGPVDWVSGACVLVRRTAFEAVGGFDEGFFLYGEDADLCLRLRAAGWRAEWVPDAVARHESGASSGRGVMSKVEWARGWARLADRHARRPVAARAALAGALGARWLVWRCLGNPHQAARWREAARALRAAPRSEAFAPPRIELLDVPIDAVSLAEAVDRVCGWMNDGAAAHVVTLNLDMLYQAGDDRALRAAIRAADMVVADGVPVLWMATRQGTPLRGRVNGTDLVHRLLERAGAARWPVAFVGGAPGVAAAAARAAERRYGVVAALVDEAPAEELDDPVRGAAVAGSVAASGARLLLLGIRAGRQERWIASHRQALGPLVAVGVGSALDFLAGTQPRAPRWMQRAGLEWAFRLSREPRRLWRRYLVEDPQVLLRFMRSLAGRR